MATQRADLLKQELRPDRSYREYLPHPRLQDRVRALWTFEIPAGFAFSQADHLILPDGCIDIVEFHQAQNVRPNLVGAMRLPQRLVLEGPLTLIGIRFWPGGLRGLTALPLDHFTDTRISLSEIMLDWPEYEPDVCPFQRLTQIEHHILEQTQNEKLDPLIQHLTQAVYSPHFHGDTGRLARELGVSLRTLERRSLAASGLSPKTLARVFRFERAAERLRKEDASLANIAMELAYADQAHFSREFRSLAGQSPRRFRAQAEAVAFLQDIRSQAR